jgi:putative transposase
MAYLKCIEQNDLNLCGKIWQRSFYDHIIRDDVALRKIRQYVIDNPKNWETDEENVKKVNQFKPR